MPRKIVPERRRTETLEACGPQMPEWNLRTRDVERFSKELTEYMKEFASSFQRVEQRQRSQSYVHGLLGNAMRKNVEQIALGLGENVRSLQYFVGQSKWEVEPVIAIHQGLIGETLGEKDGVALIDESSTVKQGEDSVGVARQYCGSVGKIANGQVGVYLGYASRKGYSLIEGQLFMPEKWFRAEHAVRRQACGVPKELVFKTKPEIGLEMLQNAQNRGNLSFAWVVADELYGDPQHFEMVWMQWESGISRRSKRIHRSGAPNRECIFPSGKVMVVIPPACVCAIQTNIRHRSRSW
jgi:SRSO17 transposase